MKRRRLRHRYGRAGHKLGKMHDLWLCEDCTIAEVNGDYSGMDDETQARVERGLDELTADVGHISSNWDSETGEGIRDFSWSRCDACGTALGGSRHRFAWFERRGK